MEFLHRNGGSILRRGKIVVQVYRRRKLETGGKTPLHYACQNNHLSIVKYLLSNLVETSIQDLEGETPLHIACRNGFVEIVKELTNAGTITGLKNNRGETAFDATEDVAILDVLRSSGALINQLDKTGSSPLHRCAEEPRLFPKLKWLIETGADVNQENDNLGTPLHASCYSGNLQAIKFLIKLGAVVNSRDKYGASPLHRACACTEKPSTEETITHMLLQHQATLPRTIATGSSQDSPVKAVEILLEHGAVLDALDNWQETPLCRASSVGNLSVLKLLIQKGARVNMPSTDVILGKHRSLQTVPCVPLNCSELF